MNHEDIVSAKYISGDACINCVSRDIIDIISKDMRICDANERRTAIFAEIVRMLQHTDRKILQMSFFDTIPQYNTLDINYHDGKDTSWPLIIVFKTIDGLICVVGSASGRVLKENIFEFITENIARSVICKKE